VDPGEYYFRPLPIQVHILISLIFKFLKNYFEFVNKEGIGQEAVKLESNSHGTFNTIKLILKSKTETYFLLDRHVALSAFAHQYRRESFYANRL